MPLPGLGAGDSNLALLIALTALAAVLEMFLKKVPLGDCPGGRFSMPL